MIQADPVSGRRTAQSLLKGIQMVLLLVEELSWLFDGSADNYLIVPRNP